MHHSLRPTKFSDIIGQSNVVQRLHILTKSCQASEQVIPHILIDGPPGLGKTTIAGAIASEMNVNLYTVNAANIRSPKNIIPYLS